MSAFLVTHLENKFIIKVHTVHGTNIFSKVAYRCQQCKGAKSKDITYHVGKLPFMTKKYVSVHKYWLIKVADFGQYFVYKSWTYNNIKNQF